jgi:hypothetical protein
MATPRTIEKRLARTKLLSLKFFDVADVFYQLAKADARSNKSNPSPPAMPAGSSPLRPGTTEVSFDAKWSFLAKKEADRDCSEPVDCHRGDGDAGSIP